jgi:hypothetical protein
LRSKFTIATCAATTTITRTATTRNNKEVSTKLNNWGFYECHYF